MADIARGARSVTLGTAVSRVLGLVREMVINHLFGAGMANDAFRAAFRMPNLLRDLFAENALSSAFIPVLADLKDRGPEAENRFASNVFNILLLTVGLVSVLGVVFSGPLTRLMVGGFGGVPGKLELTGRLTAVMFPFLLFIALAAWAMSWLNTKGSFFVPAVAPGAFNIFSFLVPLALFAYLTGRGVDPIYGAAWGVVAGGLMQFLIQVPRLFRKGFRYRTGLSFRDPDFKRVLKLFVPVAIGVSGPRICFFINTMLIASLPEKSLSWLESAYRIMHLPLGLFGVALGTVALPAFSRFVSQGRSEELRATLQDSLRLVLFLTVPTSVLIAVLAGPVTSLIYVHGRFTAADGAASAGLVIIYMLGIPFMSVLRNLAAVFFAHKDARWPMIASFISVGLTIVLNLSLKGVLGIKAFPLSTTISAAVNAALLFALLPRKIGRTNFRPLAGFGALLALASVAGGAAAWAASRGAALLLGASRLALLGNALFSFAVGGAVFLAACLALRLKETRSFLSRFLGIR